MIKISEYFIVHGTTGLFARYGERHGIIDITKHKDVTTYEGLYLDNRFKLEYIPESEKYRLLGFCPANTKWKPSDDLRELITFVTDEKVLEEYYKYDHQKSFKETFNRIKKGCKKFKMRILMVFISILLLSGIVVLHPPFIYLLMAVGFIFCLTYIDSHK